MHSGQQIIRRSSQHIGRILLSIATLLCCLLSASCTSVESTMVTRNETNEMWERHNCLNGIPITLKVPTHLKVYVFHKHYLEIVADANGKTIDVKPLELDVIVRDFAHELMYTDKIFMVDFKRPAAGSSNLKVNMTEQQYIDSIQHDITDETISQVSGLLGKFVGGGGLRLNAAAAAGEVLPNTTEIKSLVAVGIFEIESPDFEQQVREFINCHVNKAHDAWVVPSDVHSIHRAGMSDNLQVPYPPLPLCPGNGMVPGPMQPCLPYPAPMMPPQLGPRETAEEIIQRPPVNAQGYLPPAAAPNYLR